MNEEDGTPIVWNQCVELLVIRLRRSELSWWISVAQSAALQKAFEGLEGVAPLDELHRQMLEVIGCLHTIQHVKQWQDTPWLIENPSGELRNDRQRALTHLWKAQELLSPIGRVVAPDFADEIVTLMTRISASPLPLTIEEQFATPFLAGKPSRKGKANTNPRGAFNGWMVRELGRRVPQKAPKRAAAIAGLLALVDIQVEPTAVATILRRQPTA